MHILPSGSQVVPFGLTDGQTDMTKLIVTFRNFANTPKMFLIHAEMYISALFLFRDNAVGIATRYGMGRLGYESRGA